MIPSDMKFDANATPPQWSSDDNDDLVEKGTNIRIKIKGLRSEVDKMYAVGTIKEVWPAIYDILEFWLTLAPGLSWSITTLNCSRRSLRQIRSASGDAHISKYAPIDGLKRLRAVTFLIACRLV